VVRVNDDALKREVHAAMERWRGANVKRAELGLIAETVGLEWEGEPWNLETGAVLGAVREAINAGGKDQ
jgi:hypothetical protein